MMTDQDRRRALDHRSPPLFLDVPLHPQALDLLPESPRFFILGHHMTAARERLWTICVELVDPLPEHVRPNLHVLADLEQIGHVP